MVKRVRDGVGVLIFFAAAVACQAQEGSGGDSGGTGPASGGAAGSATGGQTTGGAGGIGAGTGGGASGSGAQAGSASGVRSCDGVTCSGAGTCFIDADGLARCQCLVDATHCNAPTADLRCIPLYEVCLEANLDCAAPAICKADYDPCTCAALDNPVRFHCGCRSGERYDGTGCVDDGSAEACAPTQCAADPSERMWELHATGDVTVDVVDQGSYERTWNDGGALGLYNFAGAPQCGSLHYAGKFATAGTYDLATAPVGLTLDYADKQYENTNPGAAGTVVVNQVSWCADFECTVVDLTFEGTFATASGAVVEVNGFIRGTRF